MSDVVLAPNTPLLAAGIFIHEIIRREIYDKYFLEKYVSGFDELCYFIEQYSPAWAAQECGVKEKAIRDFVDEVAKDMPRVIFHPGWNLSRYKDSFYASRALYILNVLMGNIEQEGGLIIPKGHGDCGVQGIRNLDCAKPDIKRADGVSKCTTHALKFVTLTEL